MKEIKSSFLDFYLLSHLLTYFFENRNQVLRKRFGRVMKKKSYPLIFVHPKKWTFEYPLINVHPQTKMNGIRKLVGLRYTCTLLNVTYQGYLYHDLVKLRSCRSFKIMLYSSAFYTGNFRWQYHGQWRLG